MLLHAVRGLRPIWTKISPLGITGQPLTASTTIGIGGGAGTLQLAASLFSGASAAFQDGFSSITVGGTAI